MKPTFAVVLLVTLSASAIPIADDDHDWTFYKAKHGKTYSTPREEIFRKEMFLKHRDDIMHHNSHHDAGLFTFKKRLNQFSDMGTEERNSHSSCLTAPSPASLQNRILTSPHSVSELPDFVDWRDHGAVTPIKDQGSCGSCWAFGTTGLLEGAHFMKTGKLVSLSEQNFLDCDWKDLACRGGMFDTALEFAMQEGGIDTEESYPYVGYDELKCDYNASNSGVTVSSYSTIANNTAALMHAVATKGPVAVAIHVLDDFMSYGSGIYRNETCNSIDGKLRPNHAVLLVGYGTEQGQDYWLIKNSWNTIWGEKGYGKISRDHVSDCLITWWPFVVEVEDDASRV